MKYLAAFNYYGNQTSMGFANTWKIYVFKSRLTRDTFVNALRETNITARTITRKDLSQYCQRSPKPFSGEAYVICDQDRNFGKGYLGYVTVDNPEFSSFPKLSEA